VLRLVVVPLVVALLAVSATGMNGRQEPSTWIAVCQAAASPDQPAQITYEAPGQPVTALLVAGSAPPACEAVRLTVAPTDVVWARLVPPAVADRLSAGFLLQGGEPAPAISSEIVLLDEKESAPSPAAQNVREPGEAPPRAMWAWRPAQWREESSALFALAASWKVGVLYITVPVAGDGTVAEADRLREFLGEAAGRGLAVWAVDGEPRALLPAERAAIERRTRALRAFNASGPPRLAGVQFDIEPYLVSGYSMNEERWNDAYVATIQQLKEAAGAPVEVAVPFWWLNARVAGTSVMDRLAASIDSVAVMDYRTDVESIERFATPWLEWGREHRRQVRIALEAGSLPNEPRYHFQSADVGSLWQVRIGEARVLVLLQTPRANPSGPAFAQIASSTSDASRVTFFGHLDRLRAVLPDVERRLNVSPAFGGVALHEVAASDDGR
jgi:hypothetical protein